MDDKGDFVGFDLVIGNPPYIALQSIDQKNMFKDAGFTIYTSTGDIYQLFMEMGFHLINPHGMISFIVSNKWMRAGYGATTRKWLYESADTYELIAMEARVFAMCRWMSILSVSAL